jgi:hypothetical protein
MRGDLWKADGLESVSWRIWRCVWVVVVAAVNGFFKFGSRFVRVEGTIHFFEVKANGS